MTVDSWVSMRGWAKCWLSITAVVLLDVLAYGSLFLLVRAPV